MHTHMHTHAHTRTHTRTHTHAHAHTHTHTCTHTRTHAHTHTHTHAHTRTHTHKRTRTTPADSERLAALSNRAAALVCMERYREAVQDVDSALSLMLSGLPTYRHGLVQLHQWVSELHEAAETTPSPATDPLETTLPPSSEPPKTMPPSSEPPETTPPSKEQHETIGTTPPPSASEPSASTREPGGGSGCSMGAGSSLCGVDRSQLGTLARLLARRGAACSYLRQHDAACADYRSALQLQQLLGEVGRAAAMRVDLERLEGMRRVDMEAQGQGGGGAAGGGAAGGAEQRGAEESDDEDVVD